MFPLQQRHINTNSSMGGVCARLAIPGGLPPLEPSEVGFAAVCVTFLCWEKKKIYHNTTFNAKEQGRQRYKMPWRCKEIENFYFR